MLLKGLVRTIALLLLLPVTIWADDPQKPDLKPEWIDRLHEHRVRQSGPVIHITGDIDDGIDALEDPMRSYADAGEAMQKHLFAKEPGSISISYSLSKGFQIEGADLDPNFVGEAVSDEPQGAFKEFLRSIKRVAVSEAGGSSSADTAHIRETMVELQKLFNKINPVEKPNPKESRTKLETQLKLVASAMEEARARLDIDFNLTIHDADQITSDARESMADSDLNDGVARVLKDWSRENYNWRPQYEKIDGEFVKTRSGITVYLLGQEGSDDVKAMSSSLKGHQFKHFSMLDNQGKSEEYQKLQRQERMDVINAAVDHYSGRRDRQTVVEELFSELHPSGFAQAEDGVAFLSDMTESMRKADIIDLIRDHVAAEVRPITPRAARVAQNLSIQGYMEGMLVQEEGNDLPMESLAMTREAQIGVQFMENVSDNVGNPARLPGFTLLSAPPGVSKSHVFETLAKYHSKPVLRLDLGAIKDQYVGGTNRKLAKLEKAFDRLTSGTLIWIDEANEAIGQLGRTGGGNDDSNNQLNKTLRILFERARDKGIVVIAADSSNGLALLGDVEGFNSDMFRRATRTLVFGPSWQKSERDMLFEAIFGHLAKKGDVPSEHVEQIIAEVKKPRSKLLDVDEILPTGGEYENLTDTFIRKYHEQFMPLEDDPNVFVKRDAPNGKKYSIIQVFKYVRDSSQSLLAQGSAEREWWAKYVASMFVRNDMDDLPVEARKFFKKGNDYGKTVLVYWVKEWLNGQEPTLAQKQVIRAKSLGMKERSFMEQEKKRLAKKHGGVWEGPGKDKSLNEIMKSIMQEEADENLDDHAKALGADAVGGGDGDNCKRIVEAHRFTKLGKGEQ